MPVLTIIVDEKTLDGLTKISAELGRGVEDLAEAAVSEAVVRYDAPPQREGS